LKGEDVGRKVSQAGSGKKGPKFGKSGTKGLRGEVCTATLRAERKVNGQVNKNSVGQGVRSIEGEKKRKEWGYKGRKRDTA